MGIEKCKFSESILQKFWQNNSLEYQYKLSNGIPINILFQGVLNYSQGPDFTCAKVIINEIEFWGDIEIHVNASHWDLHGHQKDTNYNNVILHVVWNNDQLIQNFKGDSIPTLVLSEYFSVKDLYDSQNNAPPCLGVDWQSYYKSHIFTQLRRALDYRFNEQLSSIQDLILRNKGNIRRSVVFWVATYLIDKKNRGQLEIALGAVKDSIVIKGNIGEILFLLIDRTGLNMNNLCNDFRTEIQPERDFVVYRNKYKPLTHEWTWKKSTANRGMNLESRMLQVTEFIVYAYQNWKLLEQSMDFRSLDNWFRLKQKYAKPISKNKQVEVWVNTIGIYYSYNNCKNLSLWENQLLDLRPIYTGPHKRFLGNFSSSSEIENKWEDHAIIHQVMNWCDALNCEDCNISSIKN